MVRMRLITFCVSSLVLLFSSLSLAGTWRVSPIRLEFGRGAKSGVIKVINEAEEKLTVQMKAFEWTQDAEGKDDYKETGDILFFPRIMVFEMKEERVLRVGIKMPAVKKEKTYRLFIEEIPGPRKAEETAVAIAIRIGVPLFLKPVKEEVKGEIENIGMAKGRFSARVRNAGNVHFTIHSILVKGKNPEGEDLFTKGLSGWYLLAGASRVYSTEIPSEGCLEAASIVIEVNTDKFTISGKLDADKSMCLQ
jgi:fimbrial chaperone protein